MEPNRQTAVTSLAVVGFLALVGLGVWGAVAFSRYMPGIVNTFGTAAVYLSTAFSPAEDEPQSPSAPTATSTIISFGDPVLPATTTAPIATTTRPAAPAAITPGPSTETVIQTGGTVAPAALYGKSDLVVTVTQIGYLNSNTTSSFIGSNVVPDNKRPAVKFTIKNIGTNVSGAWRFSAEVPTRTRYTYKSERQLSLNPGESIEYVLGFDQARTGENRIATITANYDGAVDESNTKNNTVDVSFNVE